MFELSLFKNNADLRSFRPPAALIQSGPKYSRIPLSDPDWEPLKTVSKFSDMPSVKDIVREKILHEVIRSVKTSSGWKILVVDHVSLRIVSAACRMYDIMEEGVTLVEKIDPAGKQKRQPLPEMDAIYMITPSAKSIDALVEDYKSKAQYGDVHLFFTSKVPDSQLTRIKGAAVLNRIKTMKEMNLEFLAYESGERASTVVLDPPDPLRFPSFSDAKQMPDSLQILFSPDYSANRDAEIGRSALQLMTLCAALGEYPIVRYAKNSKVASAIASKVADKIDAAKRAGVIQVTSAAPATILVVDRSVDPLAPLLHEFTYQAMAYDLLEILTGDRFKYVYKNNQGKDAEKEVILGEADQLWPTLRHMHIAEVINYVIDQFNDFLKTNKATKLAGKDGVKDLTEMTNAVRELPQYRELLGKYSLHLNLAKECMNKFQESKLDKLAALEQDMATGEDADGKEIKGLVANMLPILGDLDCSKENKMRLLMIYIITQEGIRDSEREKLFKAANMTIRDQNTVLNLFDLGVSMSKGLKGMRGHTKKKKKSRRKEDVPYELSRYTPFLKNILEELIKDELSATEYPYMREASVVASSSSALDSSATSLRKSAKNPKWAKPGSNKKEDPNTGPRVIVFVAGGMTYSESRACYELATQQKREIIIASSHFWTPAAFVESLLHFKRAPATEDDGDDER